MAPLTVTFSIIVSRPFYSMYSGNISSSFRSRNVKVKDAIAGIIPSMEKRNRASP